ncbi:MAG TPA: nuclear transport factor 2 family protein [Chitinophagaceae bacterium]
MKRLIAFVFAAGTVCFLSCNSGGMSATAKKNLEVNDAIMKAYEAGDFSKMGDYIAADAVDHGGETGDIKGLDSIISEMKRYKAMVTDMKYTTIKEMADDEYVFTWASVDCKMGGNPMKMTSLDVSKFKDGKAVEHWVYMDPKEVAQMMMQNAPQPAAPAPADTTAKK